MRTRLDRLIAGEFRAHDISKLFLYLRQEAARHRVVKEVAHFMAHPERTQGMLPDLMSDIFTLGRWVMEHLDRNSVANCDDLPADMPEVLRAARRLIPASVFKTQLRMKAGRVNAGVERLIERISLKPNGRAQMSGTIHVQDFALFRVLISHLISRPAFTQEDLFKDFEAALRTVGILEASEKLPAHISPWLMLLTIEAMHGATMTLGEWSTELAVGTSGDGALWVTMTLAAPSHIRRQVPFAFPAVTTTMNAQDWCEPAFPQGIHITVPVELSPSAKIVPA